VNRENLIEAVHAMGLQIHILNASTEDEIDTAFAVTLVGCAHSLLCERQSP
jgi:hypothetical protein